jgi:hemolysin D
VHERRALAGDLASLRSSISSLTAQRLQKQAERTRLANTIASQEELLKIEDDRVQLRHYLQGKQLSSTLNLSDAQESLQSQRTSLAQQEGELAQAEAALGILARYEEHRRNIYRREQPEAPDAECQIEETVQKLTKAGARKSRMVLR